MINVAFVIVERILAQTFLCTGGKIIRLYVEKSHRLASFNAVAPKFRRLIT